MPESALSSRTENPAGSGTGVSAASSESQSSAIKVVASKIGYPVKIIDRNDGLPSCQVHRLAQDQQNVFWFIGPSGLAKYDGARVIALDQRHGLSFHGLRSIAVDETSHIWVGSDIGLDIVAPDGTIQPAVKDSTWSYGLVECIVPDTSGIIWLGTAWGLVKGQPEQGWALEADERLQGILIRALVQDARGRIWVAVPQTGLLYLDGQSWRLAKTKCWQELGVIHRLMNGSADTILVCGENGLMQMDSNGTEVRRLLPADSASPITAVLSVADELWLGIGGELRHYKAEGHTWALREIVLQNTLVNDLYADRIGNIWCATDSTGVIKISTLYQAIIKPELPDSGAVFAIRQTDRNDFLVGGEHHSWRVQPEEEILSAPLGTLNGNKVWDILTDSRNNLWAATQAGLFLCTNGTSKRIGAHDPVLSSPGRVLLERKDGLWVGTLSGLTVISQAGQRQIKTPAGDSLGYVYTLTEDHEGELWIGTLGNGLWRATATGVTQIVAEGIRPSGNIMAIAPRPDGAKAVLQDNRIVLLQPDGTARVLAETADPVAGWSALWKGNNLWVGSSSGLREYDGQSGAMLRQIIQCLGAAGWEFTTSRSLAMDNAGRLLCGLNSGLAIVDPQRLDNFHEAPTVKLSRLKWTNAKTRLLDDVHIVFHSKWILTVDFFTAWFVEEDDVQYRYRLVGFEESWSEPTRLARVTYNSLPPGDYELEAQAYAPLVGWGPVSRLVKLHVRPPKWAQGWTSFPLRAIDAVQGLLEARWRNRHLHRRNQELEQHVQERTKEVEAANRELQKLNQELSRLSFTDQLTGVANRRFFNQAFNAEFERARRHQLALSLIMLDVDHFKSYNDHYGHPQGDECLKAVAGALAASLRSAADLIARYGGEEFVIVLPNTEKSGAMIVAEKLRQAVEALQSPHAQSTTSRFVTISLGVITCSFPHEAVTAETLLSTLDQALYQAKRDGRNQVAFQPLV